MMRYLLLALLLLAGPAASQVTGTGSIYVPNSSLAQGAGIPAFLATPSSANLATALTDETGGGVAVFGTSPTLTTQLTVSTGADNTVIVCKDASLTTYNMISLNGTCVDNAATGLLAGATADSNLYFNNKAGGTFSFRVAASSVFGISAAGVITTGTIGDVKNQNFVVSTAPVNRVDTTFATVTGLSMTLTAGKTYNCRGHLTVTAAPAAGGIKVQLANADTLTLTSGSITGLSLNAAANVANSTATALGSAVAAATATVTDVWIDAGLVVNAAGTLAVQFAQNAASGTTTVGANSTFNCIRVN